MKTYKRKADVLLTKREAKLLKNEFEKILGIVKLTLPNEPPVLIRKRALASLYSFFLEHWHFELRQICPLCQVSRYLSYTDKEIKPCRQAGYCEGSGCYEGLNLPFMSACEQADIPAYEIVSEVIEHNLNNPDDANNEK